jgi:protein-L-isoaspartate(D-aspartate) O-methyltransferase
MVEDQIAGRGVHDGDVLAALRSVPRHLFVPRELEEKAYVDSPLSIGFDQTISQPYMVAVMTELLRVNVRSRVLEIGAGSGYQTAVLAEVAGEVYAMERLAALAEGARAVLARLGYHNVYLAIGDGTRGWPQAAPFEAILVAAAAEEPPPALLRQLAEGGRLVMPIGQEETEQVLTVFERDRQRYRRQRILSCRFVPLVGDQEAQHPAAAGRRHATLDYAERRAREGDMDKTVDVHVFGRVQNVFYRASARSEGDRLGLRGWVKNNDDGTVVLHLQGHSSDVDAMLDWCRVGPPAARVDRVEVSEAPADGSLTGFEVRE